MNENKIFYNPSDQKLLLNDNGVVFSSGSQAFIHVTNGTGVTISAQGEAELIGKNITLGGKEINVEGKEAIEMVCGASSLVMDGFSNETHYKAVKVKKESPSNTPISLPNADEIALMVEQAQLLNEFIDIIDGHPNQPYPCGYRRALIERFRNAADPFWQRLLVEFMHSDAFNPNRRDGHTGNFQRRYNWINLDYNEDLRSGMVGRVYFHEAGHLIDWNLANKLDAIENWDVIEHQGWISVHYSDFARKIREDFENIIRNRSQRFPWPSDMPQHLQTPSEISNPDNWTRWGHYYERFYESIGNEIYALRNDEDEVMVRGVRDILQPLSRVYVTEDYVLQHDWNSNNWRHNYFRRRVNNHDGVLGSPGYIFINTGSATRQDDDNNDRFDIGYWTGHKARRTQTEAFAHFFDIMFDPDRKALYMDYFGNAIRYFEDMVRRAVGDVNPDLLRSPNQRTSSERSQDDMQDAYVLARREIRDSERSVSREEAQQMIESQQPLDLDLESMEKDPANKVLVTNSGQAVILTPDSIIIKCNDGTFIKFTDGDGIQIATGEHVLIKSESDISLISEDTVTLKGMNNMKMSSENVKGNVTSGKVEIESEKVKVN